MKLLIIAILSISFTAQATIVARVISVEGNAFSFSGNQSKTLAYGSRIMDLSEIMVEDGSTLSVSSVDGYIIHINGGSLVKFFKKNIELKNGHIWINNTNNIVGTVSSANSVAGFKQGQFIYSFDNISGRTQLLVLTGNVKLANALEPALQINIPSGHFSLIDKEYERGLPRGATKVGLKSYKQMKNVFANFKNLEDSKLDEMLITKTKVKRAIASVAAKYSSVHNHKRGKLITVRTFKSSRTPASTGPMNYYLGIKKSEAKRNKPQKTGNEAIINYYGRTWNKSSRVTRPSKAVRKPASVKPISIKRERVPASVSKSNLINDLRRSGFEKSLDREAPKVQRHTNEVNHLIDELNSFKQDYNKKY